LEFFITQKLIKTRDRSSFARNAINIAIISVSLGLSVMIIAVAIVTGFQNEIADKVIGFGAHIQISMLDNNLSLEAKPIDKNDDSFIHLKSHPDISHIQSFALKPGIIKTDEEIQGIVVKGIDTDFEWQFFEKRLLKGSKLIFNDTAAINNIIISKIIAHTLKLDTSDKIQLWFIQNPPRVRLLNISGIYETGLEEFDKMFILADIKHIQKLNNWSNNQVSGIEIFINNFENLESINEYVNNEIGYDMQARTIKDIYPALFDWLKLLDMNAVVILIIMLFVASVNMITTLLIIIIERTNMIGILKAVGAKNASIRKIFLYYGMYILFKGLLWGNIISIALCLIQMFFGIITLPQESYFVDTVPINLNFIHIILINIGTIICCFLILLLPSFIITRISPVSAIKYD